MNKFYSDELNVQIVISLLKAKGIRKIIASPGATNVTFVGSIQNDPYFEIFSAVDERSAAYMACGIAAESGEPVVISCTGATASRNYIPGMTEAFYRKLPVIALTSTQVLARVGHHIAQVIDRGNIQNDIARISLDLPVVKDETDRWECEIKVNKALLELKRNGGGPVHINLPTTYSKDFSVKELPQVQNIDRITTSQEFPPLPKKGKIAIFIGSHIMNKDEEVAIDNFCASNNAVVFCDHTSGYFGKYRVQFSIAAAQLALDISTIEPDLLIHIGEVSGDYPTMSIKSKYVWRVSPDGEIRDTFKKLRYVFEMPEYYFFKHYTNNEIQTKNTYLTQCLEIMKDTRSKIPELPFSNIWVASKMAPLIPQNSSLHLGILNSLRSWNLFEIPKGVTSFSNVGGFGIDGCVSTLIGASVINKDKLYYGVVGDLAFFYDMNSIGNRHVGNNVRLLIVNNGKGTEFRNFNHPASNFGEDADKYMAAASHFGNKSFTLIKSYSESLGFEYMFAANKEEFNKVYKRFLTSKITDKPMIFEVFTDSEDESNALEIVSQMDQNTKGQAKKVVKRILGERSINMLKSLKRK